MFIVIGLGNPGSKYAGNRHNVGFMTVDEAAGPGAINAFKHKFKADLYKTRVEENDVVFLKPLTFMNLSGIAVNQVMSFYRAPLQSLVVVHDELDLEYGTCRIKLGGGAAGHKGVKSIIEQCGGDDFTRVRIGVGRPCAGEIEEYVLSDFSHFERQSLANVVSTAAEAVRHVIERGAPDAMNRFNSRNRGRQIEE